MVTAAPDGSLYAAVDVASSGAGALALVETLRAAAFFAARWGLAAFFDASDLVAAFLPASALGAAAFLAGAAGFARTRFFADAVALVAGFFLTAAGFIALPDFTRNSSRLFASAIHAGARPRPDQVLPVAGSAYFAAEAVFDFASLGVLAVFVFFDLDVPTTN